MTKTGYHHHHKQKGNELPTISETTPLEHTVEASTTVQDDRRNGPTSYDEDDKDGGDHLGSSPLWSGSNVGWELTWPIWHFLPREERKTIAEQHGYKSIGKFEEYMSLQHAVDVSGMPTFAANTTTAGEEGGLVASASHQKPYPNESIYPKGVNDYDDKDGKHKNSAAVTDDDDDGDDDAENMSEIDDEKETNTSDGRNKLGDEGELVVKDGTIFTLPEEVMHQIFSCLPVDAYGTMALVSPHWKYLTRTESVYRRLCERVFLNQSKRRQLHVNRFDGSYRRMLEIRPRVRAVGGCYVLKYSHIRKIQRDMWTEIPHGAILETVYYRYLYFQENGRVLYALSSAPPNEMFLRLLKVVLHKPDDPAAVWGTYQVQKHNCTIVARQEWHTVKFDLAIVPTSVFGRFAALTMERHLSSPSGCFDDWSHDRVEYDVPSETFRFIKDSRL